MLACAGCLAGDAPDGYPVEAVAELGPLGFEPARVAGPIEFLGTGMPSRVPDAGARTIAAYRVDLADGVEALVALVNAPSCGDREPRTTPEEPVAVQTLGVIRRVGAETHFFTPQVRIGDRVVDIDTETATAYAPRDARVPRIVIALDFSDFRVIACGEVVWR